MTFEQLSQLTEANAKAIDRLINSSVMFQRDLMTLEQAILQTTENVNRLAAENAEMRRQWEAYLTREKRN